MFLRQITDEGLAQNAYLIGCQRTGEAIIVDPERDVDRYLRTAEENGLRLTAVAETHIHADYLGGAHELIERHGARGYLSAEGGDDWQFEWARDLDAVTLLRDGDTFHAGNIEIRALLTPGHTPEHLSFLVTDLGAGAREPMALLSGDFIFVGDVGRPDLLESAAGQAGAMEPSARTLYESLRETQRLPGFVQILPAHGAGSACGKALGAVPGSVLDYERRNNGALRLALEGDREKFVNTILDGQPEPPLYFARMKRDNRRGPALLPGGNLPQPRKLGVDELEPWLAGEGRKALDLRTDRAAFAEKHVKGSLFTPLTGGNFTVAAGSYVSEDEEVLLILENEADLEQAVRALIRIGLDHIGGWISANEALASGTAVGSLRRMHTRDLDAAALEHGSVLDVRGSGEFAAGHVKDAVNIAHTRLAARKDEIPEAEPVMIHCAAGMRAAMASAYVASLGREVRIVDGPFGEISKDLLI